MISKPIARPLKKEGATVALSVLAGICSAGLNLSRPWLLGAIIGELVRSDPDHRIAGYIGAYLASWCLSWAAALTIRFAAAKVEQRILRSLRIDILTHLFNLPMAESERQPEGRMQAYMSSDLPAWARLYGTVLTQTVHSAVQFAGAAVALTSFGPALAWGVLPFLILGSAAPLLISRMLIGVNRSAQDAVSGLLERLAGLVRGGRRSGRAACRGMGHPAFCGKLCSLGKSGSPTCNGTKRHADLRRLFGSRSLYRGAGNREQTGTERHNEPRRADRLLGYP